MKWRIPWRTVSWLAVTALLFAWTAFLRPRNETGIQPERFWFDKLDWRGCADCILVGDSRMVVSVPPAPMLEELPGLRILNAAFYGAAYTPSYIQTFPRVLDPKSRDRSIVLAIAPRSFTRFAALNSDFDRRCPGGLRKRLVAEVKWAFGRIPIKQLLADFLPVRPIARAYQHFCADGWVAMYSVNSPPMDALKHYQELFSTEDVVPEMIDGLLAGVREWTAAGIRVYGFPPPCTREMVEMEKRLSTFSEEDFIRRFEAAGGIWVQVPSWGYPSYDGSHLTFPAALEFAHDLAVALRRIREGEDPHTVSAVRQPMVELPPRWLAQLPPRFLDYYQNAYRAQLAAAPTPQTAHGSQ